MERAVISAEAQRLTPTGTKWQTLRSAETDDRGEYRLTKLATGTYVLRVRPSPTLQSWDARYLGFYYPSADLRRDAEAVAAREGQETRANFVMKPREGFEIRGRATVPDTCRQLGRTQVRLENPDAFLSWMVGAEVADDGTFAIRHVPAGEYILHAELGRDTNEMRPPVCSAGRHIEVSQNLDVALSLNVPKLQDWSGTIEGSAINPERTHIFVQRAGSNSRPQALIRPDGTFTIPGVWEGSYSITASGEGRPVSIAVGGRRVFDQPVEIEGDAAPIRIRVMDTKSFGRLAGTVKGAAGAPQLGAAVLLLPQGEGVITGMIANQNGAFSGIAAPGNYRVYAIEEASVARMYDPEFLKTRERDSRTIVVAPGENAALEFVVR